MQGRIKRGGGAGNPADRGAAGHQQPSPNAPHAAEGSRPGPTQSQAGTDAQGAKPGKETKAGQSRIGRITPQKVRGARRYALNNWRIRTRLTALLVLPVIAAIVLGGLRIQGSLQTQQQLDNVAKLGDVAQAATLLAISLENERDDMALGVSTGNPHGGQFLYDQKQTATHNQKLANLVNQLDLTQLPGNGVDIQDVRKKLGNIRTIEQNAFQANQGDLQKTIAQFDGLITPLTQVTEDLALASSNVQLVQATRSLQAFTQWHEDLAIVRSTMTAALGHMDPATGQISPFLATSDRQYALSAFQDADLAQQEFRALYGTEKANNLIGSWQNNTNVSAFNRTASALLNNTQGFVGQTLLPVQDWFSQSGTQMQLMVLDETVLVQELNNTAAQLRSQAQTDAYVNAGLIALVLVVAIAGAALVARSMVRTLAKLQETAEDVAEHTLPEMVRKLSESDPQDVDVSIAPIGIDTTDEIGHVARAFDKVHSQAVRLAAEQALLRGNINAMFTNLSRRSQGLIQRQLSMISELESREADPDQLAQLFKLDHLATRMRRNGENLLVLAGEDPGRRWTRPVPLVDVLRAAASEVEQYERIELASVPTADVAGRVVNDLVHLLAELLENATSFSSPQTRVRVTGHALPDGRVLVEIHDTGIGLSPDDLAEINERLANPPVVDVSVSRRMGLFVVGRLSLRHGIRIQLRPSDSGGTTALVMLPVDVTNVAERRAGGQAPAAPAGPQRQAAPAAPQRTPLAQGGPGGAGGRPSLPQQSQLGLPQGPGAQAGGPQGGLPRRGGQPTDGRGTPMPAMPAQADAGFGQQGLPQRGGPQQGQPGLPTRGQGPAPAQGLPQRGAPQQPAGFDPSRTDGRGMPIPNAGQPGADQTFGAGLPQGGPQQPGGHPQGGQGQPGYPQAGRTDGRGLPQQESSPWAEQPQHGSPAGQPLGAVDSTAQFARPRFEEEPQARPAAPVPPQQPMPAPQPPQQPMPQRPQADFGSDPLTRALPAADPGSTSSPIFEQMETTWFRAGRAERMRGVQVSAQEAGQERNRPEQPQAGRPVQPAQPGMPSGATAASGMSDGQAPWRNSSNDETWRRAEQVREPSAGGVMPSGLPRRVPKANLVPGTAEASTMPGPQVSRSPEEVRGRLTNLRRGIQQGRAAGAAGPDQGNGPYGSNPQER
ncbi:ATP-binding protein [Streptacidiphilus rugosus]|uniref:ATP-binding protein n=1 Tax=Streptacidiphilus rugosus TaxID=405783 RepID=UPI0005617C87|nr:ATP-binding protein [Streptacidiphilus rugosus]